MIMLQGGGEILMAHDFHHDLGIDFSAFLDISIGVSAGIWGVAGQIELLHKLVKASGTPIV